MKVKLTILVHSHNHGNSCYVSQGDFSEEEMISFHDIDFEPERDETIDLFYEEMEVN